MHKYLCMMNTLLNVAVDVDHQGAGAAAAFVLAAQRRRGVIVGGAGVVGHCSGDGDVIIRLWL